LVILTVCIIYSSAFRPTYAAVEETCVYIAMDTPWQRAEKTSDHFRPTRGSWIEIKARRAPMIPGK